MTQPKMHCFQVFQPELSLSILFTFFYCAPCSSLVSSLAKLHELKDRLVTLVKAEVKLTEFCGTVRNNLRQCTIQDKRIAIDALSVRVTASSDTIKIEGVIPIELTHTQSSSDVTTIAQTSA